MLTEENHRICVEVVGEGYDQRPQVNLLLADLARERGDLPAARKLLAEAHDWAIARDAKQPLCWSALVRAKIEFVGWALPTTNVDHVTDLVGGAHPTVAPKALADAKLSARMLLQVHDELIFEVPMAEVDPTAALVKTVMETAAVPVRNISVPLTVDVGTGPNWDEAH